MLIRIDTSNPKRELINAAAKIARAGGLVVFPTDTIYGIGTSAFSQGGVMRLFAAKKRDVEKPLGVFMRDIEQVSEHCNIPDEYRDFLGNIWPGPVTCVLNLKPSSLILPTPKRENSKTVAIRIPKAGIVHMLLEDLGSPMAQTSINISGQKHMSHTELVTTYSRFADVMIDAGEELSSEPSTVIDLTGEKPKLLREGSTSWETMKNMLEKSGISV